MAVRTSEVGVTLAKINVGSWNFVNNMAVARNVCLALSLIAITNEPLDSDLRNFMWMCIINVSTNSVWTTCTVYELIFTNVTAVHNFELTYDKFSLVRICTCGSLSSLFPYSVSKYRIMLSITCPWVCHVCHNIEPISGYSWNTLPLSRALLL